MDKLMKISQEVENTRLLEIENQKNGWLDIPDGKVTPSDIAMSIGVYGFMPLAALTSLYFIITTI